VAAVKQHKLSARGKHVPAVNLQLQCTVLYEKQHDMIVVVALLGNLVLMIKGICVVAKVMSAAGRIIK